MLIDPLMRSAFLFGTFAIVTLDVSCATRPEVLHDEMVSRGCELIVGEGAASVAMFARCGGETMGGCAQHGETLALRPISRKTWNEAGDALKTSPINEISRLTNVVDFLGPVWVVEHAANGKSAKAWTEDATSSNARLADSLIALCAGLDAQ